MKGYRFYKEHNTPADKRKDKPNGNVFAALTDPEYTYIVNSREGAMIEGYGGVFNDPNSPCCFTSASVYWLREYCKRISEAEARKIHPNLFVRIEIEG